MTLHRDSEDAAGREAPQARGRDGAERVAIVGDGQMALALADILAFGKIPATIISPLPGEATQLARTRRSPRMPGYELPAEIEVVDDARRGLAGASLIVNAIPTQFIRPTWTRFRAALTAATEVVSVAKGVETDTFQRPTEILREVIGEGHPVGVLSGPTIAGELIKHQPAVLIAAGENAALCERVQALFSSPWTRVYSSDDVVGVEIAGACKNVIAIAAGIVDGIGYGTNAKSALLARGLAEIARLGVELGAKIETFFGVAGVGDLATTCFSPEGRNRTFGEAIGRGARTEEVLRHTTSVVEGVPTAKAVTLLARHRGVPMPITEAVHAILFENFPPVEAVRDLMTRAAGAERVG